MKKVIFSKYSGAGNDFILIDNRDGKFPYHRKDLMGAMASRRTSIGADGIILLENSDRADFRMRYFNCDGGEAEMCGNGARCLIAFAKKIGIEKEEYTFETMERVLGGKFVGNEIEVEMGPPVDMDLDISLKVDGAGETVHLSSIQATLVVDEIYERQEWDPLLHWAYRKNWFFALGAAMAGRALALFSPGPTRSGRRDLYARVCEWFQLMRTQYLFVRKKECSGCNLRKICPGLPREFARKNPEARVFPYGNDEFPLIENPTFFGFRYPEKFDSVTAAMKERVGMK